MPEVWLKEQLPDGHPDHGRCTAQKVAEAGETFKRKNKDALPKRRRAAAGIAVGGKTRTAKGGNLRATPEAIQEAQRVHAALLVKEAAKAEKLKMLESQVELLWEAPPLLGGAACQTLFALGEDDCSPPEDAASSAFEVLLRVLSLCAGWTHASAALKAIERSAASVLQIIHHRHIACSWCRSYFRSISSAADYQGSRLGLDDGSDSASEYSEDGEVRPISAAIPPTAPVRKPRRAQLSRGDLVHQLLRSRSRMLNSMASWLRYLQKLLPEERLAAALVLDEGVERGRSTLIIGDIPGAAPVGASGTAPTPKVSLVRHEVLESDLKAALGIAMGRSGSLLRQTPAQRAGAVSVHSGISLFRPSPGTSSIGGGGEGNEGGERSQRSSFGSTQTSFSLAGGMQSGHITPLPHHSSHVDTERSEEVDLEPCALADRALIGVPAHWRPGRSDLRRRSLTSTTLSLAPQ